MGRGPDARLALAALAAAFFGHPSRELRVVGITGTNGKTTTAYLLGALFEAAGIRCGMLGTVVYRIGGEEREAARTTPEASDVQQLLREMVEAGCGACAMEVSSHALALQRVDEMRFAAAVFTNLTRDHLDFHGDMEAYFPAKRRLFEMLPADGAGGRQSRRSARARRSRRSRVAGDLRHRPAGRRHPATALALARRPRLRRPRRRRARAGAVTPGRAAERLQHPRGGRDGASRSACRSSAIEQALGRRRGRAGPLPGRVGADDDITVVVDYAHTDDALKNLLETARPLATRRLITVFGCGGDRDRTKRPLMGAVAARLSDVVIVTSDNPRSEDPAAIIEEIKRGIVPPADRARPAEPPATGGLRIRPRAPAA